MIVHTDIELLCVKSTSELMYEFHCAGRVPAMARDF